MTLQETVDPFAQWREGATLVIQRWLPGPAERIWQYLTDSDLRRQWLAAGDMTLAPGAPLELVWRNDDLSHGDDPRPDGFSGEHRMQSHVIAADPPRLLSFTWGQGAVTFELREKGDRVLLTVTHTGLDDGGARTMIAAGWHMHLDILGAVAMDRPAASFWSGWTALRATYRDRLPA